MVRTIQLVQKLKEDEIASSTDGEPIVNIHKWLSRTTLDVIGDGTSRSFVQALRINLPL